MGTHECGGTVLNPVNTHTFILDDSRSRGFTFFLENHSKTVSLKVKSAGSNELEKGMEERRALELNRFKSPECGPGGQRTGRPEGEKESEPHWQKLCSI